MADKRHTLQVRRSTYRGQEGWTLRGRPAGESGGWPCSIFFEHESAARRTFRQIRDGEPVPEGVEMFAP